MKILTVVLVPILFSFALAEEGQSIEKEDSGIYRLGEIQVLSSASKSSSVSASIIEEEDIQDFGGSTVVDSLKHLDGVTASTVGGRNEQAVYIRGYDLRQIPILMDGIPIYVPFDGYMDLARISVNDLSQIQVLKGYVSVLNGPNALGGAINLVSKKPAQDFHADVRGSLQTDRQWNLNGNSVGLNLGVRKEKWYSFANFTSHDKNQWRLSNDYQTNSQQISSLRDNSYNHNKKMNLKLAYVPNTDDEYSINYIIQDDSKGNPPYAGSDSTIRTRFWRWPYWKKESLYWISQTGINSGSYFKVRAYFDTFKNSLYSYDDNTYSRMTKSYAFKSFYNDYSYGSSLEYGNKISEQDELKLALHLKQDHHSEYNEGELDRNFTDRTSSVALENIYKFSGELNVIVGMSFDWREGLLADNYDSATQTISQFDHSSAQSFNPQIALVKNLNKSEEIHLTIDRKSHFPTLKDRYSYRLGSAVANSNLKPEYATKFEIGGSSLLHEVIRLNTSIFYNRTSDLIQAVNLTPTLTQNQNIGEAEGYGVDFAVKLEASAGLLLGLNYSYLQQKNISNPSLFFVNAPESKAFVFAVYDVSDRWSFFPSAELSTNRFVTTAGESVPGFILYHAKASYKFTGQLIVDFGIKNILDTNYEVASGYPEEGRNYFVEIKYSVF